MTRTKKTVENVNASTEQAKVTNVELTVTPMSVRVYQTEDSYRYRLTFIETIPGFKKAEDDTYVESEVDYIDFYPSVLIAQCIEYVENMDFFYSKKKEAGLKKDGASGFGCAELSYILKKSEMKIVRTKFVKGDEYTTSDGEVKTHAHDGYATTIAGIKVTKKVEAKLEDFVDDAMFGI